MDDAILHSLITCAGLVGVSGRRVGFKIQGIRGGVVLSLPVLIEFNNIPDNRKEITTADRAHQHPHLKPIASKIPVLDTHAHILLLIGHNLLQFHKARHQINIPNNVLNVVKILGGC